MEIERGTAMSNTVEYSLWNVLWTYRKINFRMNYYRETFFR